MANANQRIYHHPTQKDVEVPAFDLLTFLFGMYMTRICGFYELDSTTSIASQCHAMDGKH